MANYRPAFQRSDTDFGEGVRSKDDQGHIAQISTNSDRSGSLEKSSTGNDSHPKEAFHNEKYVDAEAAPAYDEDEGGTVGSKL